MPRKPNLPNLREHDARRISAAGAAVVPSRAQFVDSGLRTTPPQATVYELRPATAAASVAGFEPGRGVLEHLCNLTREKAR